jgi:hypothetical protein
LKHEEKLHFLAQTALKTQFFGPNRPENQVFGLVGRKIATLAKAVFLQ